MYAVCRQVQCERQITSKMFLDTFAVQVKYLLSHCRFKMKEYTLSFRRGGNYKMLAIPRRTLIIAATTAFGGHQFHCVRSRNDLPGTIVKIYSFRPPDIAFEESPSRIEVIYLSPAIGKRNKSGNRCFGTVSICCLPIEGE